MIAPHIWPCAEISRLVEQIIAIQFSIVEKNRTFTP